MPQYNPITGLPIDPLAADRDNIQGENNQLGYYAPALALVVKGTSRIQSHAQGPLVTPAAGVGLAAMDRDRRERLAKGDPKKASEDPKVIWEEALAKGVDNPGLIIACADYLALNMKWDHAAEFLKANLRQGIVVKPWVYEALALALRESGGSPEEIERAEVSAADLEPLDARGLLRASKAMAEHKRWDRAVAFCQQAAALQPNTSTPYAEALLYAELAEDPKSMEWAAGNLLKQDWPMDNKKIQARAAQKLDALVKKLEKKPERKQEAEKLLQTVAGRRERDLVIKLAWKGEADLDLKVTEPTASVCWALNRQSIGGGVLIGDTLADTNSESYLAAQAYSGEYKIEVERVWGKPVAETAQVRIIAHQGTKDESDQVVTVDLKNPKPIKFLLEDGRRTEAAYVPPPSAQQQMDEAVAPQNSDQVLFQLRDLSTHEITGIQLSNANRGASVGGTPMGDNSPARQAAPSKDDRVLYQTRVASFMKDSLDVTAQAVLSADRRSLRLSVQPVYTPTPANRPITTPVVNNPIIPGGD